MPIDQKPNPDTSEERLKPPPSEQEARRVIEDYANGLREIIKKLRQNFN
jgi:hypothetical protein